MRKQHCTIKFIPRYLCALTILAALFHTQQAIASDLCNPPNLIPQPACDMDSFYGEPPRQLPNGWSPFILSGDPMFVNDPHSFFGTGTLRITSNNSAPLKAGIFTQVNVNPGSGYRASVAWAAPNAPSDAWGRQLGIDPTGGTDPNSPNVIWGPIHYGDGRFVNYPNGEGPNIDVKARAIGGTMTVFFLADLARIEGSNLIYVDVISLFPDESAPSAPAPVAPTATNTAEPAPQPAPQEVNISAASVEAAPVAVAEAKQALPMFVGATEAPTPVATDTPLPTPTETVTPIPTETPTLFPTQTSPPTPTWTPWPTSVPIGALTLMGAQTELLRLTQNSSQRSLMMLSGLGFIGSLLTGGLLWQLRRKK
ncbi:MAG: hypothetical protein U0175_33815 [Caldilineaceae bacterium]